MFTVLRILISGLFIGVLARFFYPGPVPMNWLESITLGVGGSFLGGAIAWLVDRDGSREPLNRAGCLMSIIGACILIFIVRHFFQG